MKKKQLKEEIEVLEDGLTRLFERIMKMDEILRFLAKNRKEDVSIRLPIVGNPVATFLYDEKLMETEIAVLGQEAFVFENCEEYCIIKTEKDFFKIEKRTGNIMKVTEMLADEDLSIDIANKKGGKK
jgi:hypothetical protein